MFVPLNPLCHFLIEDLGRIKSMDEALSITLARGRAMTIDGLLTWWRETRAQLLSALSVLDPKTRLGVIDELRLEPGHMPEVEQIHRCLGVQIDCAKSAIHAQRRGP